MRSCFIDHNQEPQFERLTKHGITECLIPGEDSPAANPEWVKRIADRGFGVAVMFAWNWHGYGYKTGAAFAGYASDRLKQIGYDAPPGQNDVNPKVVLDIEKGAGIDDIRYVDWVVDCLTTWRRLRPTRATDWTLESMQGGLFNGRPDAVDAIIRANVGIVPQYYTGDERPMAADVAFKDLALYGFPDHRIRGFYLARELPLNWDGYAWTQGKLPA